MHPFRSLFLRNTIFSFSLLSFGMLLGFYISHRNSATTELSRNRDPTAFISTQERVTTGEQQRQQQNTLDEFQRTTIRLQTALDFLVHPKEILEKDVSKKAQTVYESARRALDGALAVASNVSPGHSGNSELQTRVYQNLVEALRPLRLSTICETGFNAGHSAMNFLQATDSFKRDVHLFEFDVGVRESVEIGFKHLSKKYESRISLTLGDSHVTLKKFHQDHPEVKCDVSIVDGDHTEEGALQDLEDFRAMVGDLPKFSSSSSSFPIPIVIVDDCGCVNDWCIGPTKAWGKWVKDGRITPIYHWIHPENNRGFAIGVWAK